MEVCSFNGVHSLYMPNEHSRSYHKNTKTKYMMLFTRTTWSVNHLHQNEAKHQSTLQGIPKFLHLYDRASDSLFCAIECGQIPGDIPDDIPCKYINGTIVISLLHLRRIQTRNQPKKVHRKKENSSTAVDKYNSLVDIVIELDKEDEVDSFLSHPDADDDGTGNSEVEQTPSESMLEALRPSFIAALIDEVLRHSDPNVQISIAYCFSEIMRITAPIEPFNNDQMKEFFHLTVMSFQKLSSESGSNYSKISTSLRIFSRFRMCVLILDLELKELVVQMFQHFFNVVGSNISDPLLSHILNIMTMVIEESEEFPYELLSLLITSMKNENQEANEHAVVAISSGEVTPSFGGPKRDEAVPPFSKPCNATILEAIFAKHGDITADSTFKSTSVKT